MRSTGAPRGADERLREGRLSGSARVPLRLRPAAAPATLRELERPRDGPNLMPASRRAVAKPKVRFQETPNPNAGKFTVGRTLVEGRRGRTFASAEAAADDPLAARLFAVPGVASVFVVADFVTVTKDADAAWAELAPRVQAALRDVL